MAQPMTKALSSDSGPETHNHMHAKKMTLTTDQNGHLQQQPELPPNTTLEAIFLVLGSSKPQMGTRQPSARIAGRGTIHGDLLAPIVDPEDWDAAR